jgi:hypothetical protein
VFDPVLVEALELGLGQVCTAVVDYSVRLFNWLITLVSG